MSGAEGDEGDFIAENVNFYRCGIAIFGKDRSVKKQLLVGSVSYVFFSGSSIGGDSVSVDAKRCSFFSVSSKKVATYYTSIGGRA